MILDIAVPIAIFLLSAAAAYILVPKNKYKNAFILLALLSVLVRMAIVSYLYSAGTEVSGTDGLLYHQEGIGISRQLADGVPFYRVKYSYTWYTVFVGIVYHILGVNRYLVSYINIGFAFWAGILILKMALEYKYRFVNAAFISLAFLYFPNLTLWTSDSRKESLLIFSCLLCWHCVQRFTGDMAASAGSDSGPEKNAVRFRNIFRIILVCVLMWVSTLIRIYMFIPIAAGIIISQLLAYKKTLSRMYAVFAASVAVSAVLIFFTTMNPLTDSYHAISFSNEPAFSTTQEVTSKMQTVKTIASNRNIAASIVNFVLLPYPGSINIADLHDNQTLEFIVSVDMVAWYLCIIMMVPGICNAVRKKESLLLGMLAFLAVYVFINALVVENVADTIYRYRSIIVGTSLLFIDGDIWGSLLARVEKLTGPVSFGTKSSFISNLSIKQ